MTRRAIALLVSLGLLGAPSDVRAQTSPPQEPARVYLEGADECTDVDSFWAQLLEKTARIRRADPGEAAASIYLRVEYDGKLWTGQFRFAAVDQHPSSPRSVSGLDCTEVVAALNLMAAVALDEWATTRHVTAPPSASTRASTPPPPAAPLPSRTTAPTSKANGPTWYLFSTAAVEVRDLGFVAWGPAAGLGMELVRPSAKPLLSSRLTGGSFAQRVIVGPALARLTWLTGRLDGCAFNVAFRRLVYARPCVAFEGGILHATAEGIAKARDIHRPWVALGPFAELETPTLGPFRAEVDLGLLLPLVETELVFDPGVPVERRMVVVPWGSVGVGFHFL